MGVFSFEKQKSSVSKELLHLVSLILDDNASSSKTDHCTQSKVFKLNFSQYSPVTKKQQSSGPVRHSKVNESSLPGKIGLLIYATTRKEVLVNKFASDGLSISYNHVVEIQSNIAKYLFIKCKKENSFPHAFVKWVFYDNCHW